MENGNTDTGRNRYAVETRRPQHTNRQAREPVRPKRDTVARPRVGSLDPALTECPICMLQLDQPKSLPCLHSFCQDCLSTYIKELDESQLTEKSFPCPVCSSNTFPSNQKAEKDKWAEQFPTNNMILAIDRVRSFQDGIHHCVPCRRKHNMYSIGEYWCKNCDYHLCDRCRVDFHQHFFDTHEIQPLTDIQKSLSSLASSFHLKCPHHQLNLDMYCEDHDVICCAKCVTLDHKKCDNLVQTSKYVRHLRTGTAWKDLFSGLDTGARALSALVDDFKNQMKEMMTSKEKAVKVIAQLRRNIDRQLDLIQTNMRGKLNQKFTDEQKRTKLISKKCEILKNSIKQSLKMSKSGMILDDDAQMVSVFQRGHSEYRSCNSIIDQSAAAYGNVDFRVQLDPIAEELKSIVSFGDVNIERTRLDLPKTVDVWPPLLSRFAKEVAKFKVRQPDDKTNCHITGAVNINDEMILMADYNNKKLKLMNIRGELLDQLTVKDNPYDLCLLEGGKVALTRPVSKTVSVYEVNSSKLYYIPDADTKLEKYCQGITCSGEDYIISSGGSSPCQVYSITKEGEDLDVIRQNKIPCNYLAFDESQSNMIVSLYNRNKAEVSVYQQNLYSKECTDIVKGDVVMGARGVDLDREGNIYVCGEASTNVVQISTTATKVRPLLTAKDGIKNPLVVCVCGSKFFLTEKNMDFIKVFQLVREK